MTLLKGTRNKFIDSKGNCENVRLTWPGCFAMYINNYSFVISCVLEKYVSDTNCLFLSYAEESFVFVPSFLHLSRLQK